METIALASGTTAEIAKGNEILDNSKKYGLPNVVGEAVKYCTNDYPKTIADYATSDIKTYADDVLTYNAANGNIAFKTYCDGGAATLAAATAAVAVATISLY